MASTKEERSERGEPAWLLALAGWMLARALVALAIPRGATELEAFPGERAPPLPPLVDALRSGKNAIELSRSPPRELRRLPGIGRRRAVDLAQARFERGDGEPLDLQAIPGIGPKIEARVRERLARDARDAE